ncbi:trypsin-like peptidase domain-containing protein [Longimicrobium sp.]|uniref:trypsin-like peptidase domain-containing protein n=1 Tax=Longimicrobium sp. TaxID=2029185 RepID=UPI002C204EFB|nr:trypsin-like peptidase domain-containing protein [Longimicrobium sp.]HSU17842.1 trypsin-like peptidase domain-containing protein [Longimicrobium sp.]
MPSRSIKTVPVVLALALLPAARAAAQNDVVNITRRANPAVITLHAFNTSGREMSLGSGFYLPDGRIATNRHVVEGASRIEATTADERRVGTAQYAEAVGGVTADLAILPRINTPPATLPLARALPEVGEAIVVIGAPEGLSNTVSTGIVSAVRRVEGRTLLQISAPISHGSSGGPVLNMRGEVVGVSVAVLAEGQNLNFAVPVTELTRLTQNTPGRIAFNGDLRFGGGDTGGRGTTGRRDISDLNTASLPRITTGQSAEGRLTAADFRRPDGSFADAYVYTGRAGERITVTLTSDDFDTWLVVDDPNGPMREYDDDSAGELNSTLTVTLPHSGQFLIVANSATENATGRYRLTVRGAGRGDVVADDDGGQGGRGGFEDIDMSRATRITAGQTMSGRLTSADFLLNDNTYVHPYVYQGRAGERITVTLRSNSFDSWLVVRGPGGFDQHNDDGAGGNDSQLTVTLPRSGPYLIAANTVGQRDTGPYTLSVQSGGARPAPGQDDTGGRGVAITDLDWRRLPAIQAGQSVAGRLSSTDVLRDDNTYMDGYVYQGRAGERITITLQSSAFDAWLVVNDPNGPLYEHDDDSGGGNNSSLTLTLPHSGPYVIVANSVSQDTGNYLLRIQSSRR